MSLNKAMLIGNVGADPEVRYLEGQNNRKVAQFRLATTERYRDRSGETRENTEWHNIVVWGPQADTVEKYVRKGSQLYIEGRIRTRQWDDRTGNKRYTTEINADNIQLLGRRESSEGGYGYQGGAQGGDYQRPAAQSGYGRQQSSYAAPQQNAYSAPQPAPAPAPVVDNPDDDLPF